MGEEQILSESNDRGIQIDDSIFLQHLAVKKPTRRDSVCAVQLPFTLESCNPRHHLDLRNPRDNEPTVTLGSSDRRLSVHRRGGD